MKNGHAFCGLIIAALLLPWGRGTAQSAHAPYHLQVQQGQTLQQAIDRLAQDYHIDFAYAPEILDRRLMEPALFSAADIESLLRQLLAGQSIQYRILADNRILLRSVSLQQDAGAASSRTVSGRILDGATGQPMMHVALALDTLNLGTLSDEQGFFSLTLPEYLWQHSLWVYHIGYKSRQVPVASLAAEPNLHLYAEPLALSEVLIVDRLPGLPTTLPDGSIRLRSAGLEGATASQLAGKDVLRQVQLQAGISAHDDLSSDIRIRGSNADETLIILDGMPLYKVDHFYGIFSALNSSYLDEVQLYKNALPIQYGGRTGGMLLLQSARQIQQLRGNLDVNLLSAALQVDVPLSSRLGLSLSGRSSHTNLAASKLFDWVGRDVDNYSDSNLPAGRPEVITTDPDFGFTDWNAKLLLTPRAGYQLAVNGYHSTDDYLNGYQYSFRPRTNLERVRHEESFQDRQDWHNTGSSIQYTALLGRNWKLEADGFYSLYRFAGTFGIDIMRTTARDTNRYAISNDQVNLVENAGYRLTLTKDYHADRRLQMGSSLNHYRTDFSIASEVDTLLAAAGQTVDAQWFAAYQWAPVKRLEVNLGSRLHYYRLADQVYVSPRLMGRYRFDSGLSLKASYSLNYQFLREITHENRLGQSIDLALLSDESRFPAGQSANYMLGAGYQNKHWTFDLEAYHKTLGNVIDHALLQPGFGNDPLRPGRRQQYVLFVGKGVVDGVDATIGWQYPHYSGHLAYTLSKATHRYEQIRRGAPVPARDDRRHQLKWINAWTLGRFQVSANLIYSSGRPYYDPRIIQNDRRREYIRWLPSYQRLDVGLAYDLKLGPTRARLGASVFNLTNHTNVKYLQFIYSVNAGDNNRLLNTIAGSQTDLLDRTLNLSLEVSF